jgi:hypothetical protein
METITITNKEICKKSYDFLLNTPCNVNFVFDNFCIEWRKEENTIYLISKKWGRGRLKWIKRRGLLFYLPKWNVFLDYEGNEFLSVNKKLTMGANNV